MTKYNGYSNKETWNICAWTMNDEGLYKYWQDWGKVLKWTPAAVQMFVEEVFPDKELKNINYSEIAQVWSID